MPVSFLCQQSVFMVYLLSVNRYVSYHNRTNSELIYRVITGVKTGIADVQEPVVPHPFTEAIKIDKPDLKAATILRSGDN